MKKFLTAIISLIMVVTSAFALVGCKDKWENTNMTNWEAVQSVGGLVAETKNYLYLVNGVGTSTDDNSFGAPIKGSLVVVDKNDLSKSEIAVPKLFTATDYTAGVYIYGDYVYYGTPCTEKNKQGNIANDQLTFMRTKLDGSDTETYFTASTLGVEYRIVENGGKVYIVYYDMDASAIKCYDTSSKKETEIAKTVDNVAGKFDSLDAYKFIPNDSLTDATVLYTVKVYAEDYIPSKAENSGYTRIEEVYNQVYLYKAGSSPICVFDGKNSELKYSLTMVKDGKLYYSTSDVVGNVKNYVSPLNNLQEKTEIANGSVAVAGNLIDLDNMVGYVINSDKTAIIKKSLTENSTINDEKVAVVSANELLFINNGYVYYKNANTEICRIKLNDAQAKEERVSKGVVVSDWYAPEVISINGEDYLFYGDASTAGSSYVTSVKLSNTVNAEDTDKDGKDDLFYLSGEVAVGVMKEIDKANVFVEAINKVEEKDLVLELVDGKYTSKEATKLRAIYSDLSDEAKNSINSVYVLKLEKMEEAVKLANLYKDLKEIDNYSLKTSEEKETLKKVYQTAKDYRIAVIEKYGESFLKNVRDTYIPDGLNHYYAVAQGIFDKDLK